MRATVTTAGSNTSTRRVTIDWNAPTISQAIGIGSLAWCGIDAWPPRPAHGDQERVGRRHQRRRPWWRSSPFGSVGDWWMAKAIDTGSAPVGRGGEQALVEHVLGAVVALLAGLEHEGHAPPQRAASRARAAWRRRRASRRGCRARRRAWRRRPCS